MKLVWIISTIGILKMLAGSAVAGGAECEFIKDSDMRHYCRAVARHAPSWCEFIRSSDLRIRCRMEVR